MHILTCAFRSYLKPVFDYLLLKSMLDLKHAFNMFSFSHVFNMLHQWNILLNTISACFQQVGPINQFYFTYSTYLWRHSIYVLSTPFMHFYNMFSATMKLKTSYPIFLSISPEHKQLILSGLNLI